MFVCLVPLSMILVELFWYFEIKFETAIGITLGILLPGH